MEKQFSKNPLTTSSHETQQPSNPNPVRECSDSLPFDLLIDIFSRVPAKSIARFRCVSKPWASILCRPDFTEFFLSKSRTRPRLFFALKANEKLFFYSSPQPQNLDDDSSLVATRYHSFYPEYTPSRDCTLVCGLALLQGDNPRAAICNPATGEFLTLPKVGGGIGRFFFGYDPINKQFKVLCIWSSYQIPKTHLVLTLETGNKPSWRKIDRKFEFLDRYRIKGEVCINGVLYFGAHENVIASFDVRSEKLELIKTFEEEMMSLRGSSMHCHFLTLFNYKGKLGILHRDMSWHEEFELWVLEDHKWCRHAYAVSNVLKTYVSTKNQFVGMTGTGEMVWSQPFYLFFYNLERKSFTRVNIQGFKEFKDYKGHITLHTFLDYAENVIKNETWSQFSKEEKRASINSSIPTRNSFDLLG